MKNIARFFLNLIWPATCSVCDNLLKIKELNPICPACRALFKVNNHPGAPHAAFVYEGALKKCLHQFKYKKNLRMGRFLARELAKFAEQTINPSFFDYIISMPASRPRLREREFNQAEILARTLAKDSANFLKNCLRRRHTVAQVKLNRRERFNNVKGSFRVNRKLASWIKNKKILLVDDVFTTGATANEASRTLLDAGVKSVEVLTLARDL